MSDPIDLSMSMPETVVRRLAPDDWRVERDLRLAALAESPSAFGSLLVDAEAIGEPEWRSRLASQTRLAAWIAGQPAGTAGWALARHPYPPGSTVLVGMWVVPSARGRGLADRLVETVIAACRSDGYVAVWLSVTHGNEAAARLYERHGFVRTGTDLEGDGDTFDMSLDLMSLDLS